MQTRLWVATLVLAGMFSLGTSSAFGATAFTDGFETQNFSLWTSVDSGTKGLWKIDTSRESGRFSAKVIGNTGATDDMLRKTLSTVSYANPTLTFSYKASSLDAKSSGEFDQFFAEYSTDGTTWTVLKEVNGNTASDLDGSWRKVSYPVPAHAALQFRFRAHLSDSGDRVWIDNVSVTGTPYENTKSACTDRIDNDEDGYVDYADTDCASFFASLTVTKAGTGVGTVTSAPAGISCGTDCFERYVANTLVTLKQTVTRGFRFSGWSGACTGLGSCSFPITNDAAVTATFDALPSYTLSAVNEPVGGGVISALGISCGSDCSQTVYEGERITASVVENPGFIFTGWSGACEGSETSCSFSVEDNASITAHYDTLAPGMCGNTVIEWNEQCDDGNLNEEDGCSSRCTIPTIVCNGTVSYPICEIVF